MVNPEFVLVLTWRLLCRSLNRELQKNRACPQKGFPVPTFLSKIYFNLARPHNTISAQESIAKMVRKLKHHEQKLLRKVDFTTYKSDHDHRDAAVIRRYAIQKPSDYAKYNRLVGVCPLYHIPNTLHCLFRDIIIGMCTY